MPIKDEPKPIEPLYILQVINLTNGPLWIAEIKSHRNGVPFDVAAARDATSSGHFTAAQLQTIVSLVSRDPTNIAMNYFPCDASVLSPEQKKLLNLA